MVKTQDPRRTHVSHVDSSGPPSLPWTQAKVLASVEQLRHDQVGSDSEKGG